MPQKKDENSPFKTAITSPSFSNIGGVIGEREYVRIIENENNKKYWVKSTTYFFIPYEIIWSKIENHEKG